MIAATKQQKPAPNAVVQQRARHVRDLAAFHGIEQQRTATQLGCTKISHLDGSTA
jgi:hypothetical protein